MIVHRVLTSQSNSELDYDVKMVCLWMTNVCHAGNCSDLVLGEILQFVLRVFISCIFFMYKNQSKLILIFSHTGLINCSL